MHKMNPALLMLLLAALAGSCSYDMDSVPYTGGGDSGSSVMVTTIAGTGKQGKQDGHATDSAEFFKPSDVAFCPKTGRIYVADTYNHRIRVIEKKQVTTYAGSSKGDVEGTGTAAKFDHPKGIAVDSDGIVYVADTGNHRIKKITADTKVSVLAGMEKKLGGHKDGGALAALFSSPWGIGVDKAKNVFVADSGNHCIRLYTPGDTAKVSTLTGRGKYPYSGKTNGGLDQAKFYWPTGLTLDLANETVYVSETGNHLVRKIDGKKKKVETFAGTGNASFVNGPALEAKFNYPVDLTHDGTGRFYVADTNNDLIRIIYKGRVATAAGSGKNGIKDGPGATAKFDHPSGIAYDAKNNVLYVADTNNNRIRMITP